MILLISISIYLLGANLLCYRAFAHDKRCAIAREYRTPEARLLLLASIGGWPGAKLAQHNLRHKTRKQPFADELNNIGIVQGLIAVTFLGVGMTLLLAPQATFNSGTQIAVEAAPRAGAPLAISLRPPAQRPATW